MSDNSINFVFPYKFDDILERASDKRFSLTQEDNHVAKMDERRLQKHLKQLREALQEDFRLIQEEERFSLLFFTIKRCSIDTVVGGGKADKINLSKNSKRVQIYGTQLNLQYTELVLDVLNSYFFILVKQIITYQNNQRYGDMPELCSCFKMCIFLIFFALQNSVIKKTKSLLDKKEDNDNEGGRFTSDHQEKKILDLQTQSLNLLQTSLYEIDIEELWSKKNIDQEIFKYYLDTCLRMFESKQLVRDQHSRQHIFKIINYIMQGLEKEELKQLQLKMINLVYEEEALVAPIADYIRSISKGQQGFGHQFAQDLLQLMVTYLQDKVNQQTESTILKNCRQLFTILSDEIPEIFYNNLRIFLSLLESDAYMMRNAVYDVILNVMKHQLVDIDEENESKHKTKEQLINLLIYRIKDKNAFCRSQVLQNLAECCQLNIIPAEYLKVLLQQAIGRTKDNGSIVRKRALALIQKIVDYYSYIFAKNAKFLSIQDIKRELQMLKEHSDIEEEKITEIEQKIQRLTTQMGSSQQQIEEEETITPGEPLKNKEKLQIDLRQHEGESIDDYISKLLEMREETAKRIVSIKLKKERLQEYSSFIEVVDILVPNLVQMLGSKNTSDVLETIKLLTQLKKFNIESAQQGMRKMLVLIFSNEKLIKEEVLNTYYTLYMDSKLKPKKIALNLISLLKEANLTEEKSFEEMLLSMLDSGDKKKELHSDIFKEILDIFTNTFSSIYDFSDFGFEDEKNEKEISIEKNIKVLNLRSALKIIRIVLKKKKKLVGQKQLLSYRNHLDRFLSLSSGKIDWIIVQEICLVAELSKSDKHMPQIYEIIKRLILLLIKNHGTQNNDWYVAADEIIKLTFLTKNDPESLILFLIKSISKFDSQEDEQEFKKKVSTNKAIGANSKKQSVLKTVLENKEIEKEFGDIQEAAKQIEVEEQENDQDQSQILDKKKDDIMDNEEEKQSQNEDDDDDEEEETEEQKQQKEQLRIKNHKKYLIQQFETRLSQGLFVASNACLRFLLHGDLIEEFLGKIRLQNDDNEQKKNTNNIEEEIENKKSKKSKKGKKNGQEDEEEEDELEKVHGGNEADYEERKNKLQKIIEQFIDDSQIFRYYKGLTQNICLDMFNSLNNKSKTKRNQTLDRVAILSLIKYMCLSYKFCKENVDLLFNLISPKSEFTEQLDGVIKTNILIGIGDLYRRYPNLLEHNLHLVYQTLQDKNPLVRKACLMVITHLVLIDKLKVKAEISNIAMLIEDDHIPIQNSVKLFFYELNKKDVKQIYNFLPDIITNLSKPNVSEDLFTNFAKLVLTTVIKDNPNDSMVDKMIQRFEITSTDQEWRNIATTMTLFQYTEKSLKRLLERFEFFRSKMKDQKILECFLQIIRKTKQFGTKTPEIKALLEEFELKVQNYKKETFDDQKYKKEKRQRKDPKSSRNANQKKKGSSRRQKSYDEDEDDDEGILYDEDEDNNNINQNKNQIIRSLERRQSGRNRDYKQVIDNSDIEIEDDDEEQLF